MFQLNHDNLPRKRAKKEKKELNAGVLDASLATAETAATTADLMAAFTELAEKVATLEAASASK